MEPVSITHPEHQPAHGHLRPANVLILPERDADLAARLENARWIEPSQDIRLTLVTCWPEYSNTHRLIIVASLLQDSFDRKDMQ